MTTKKKETKLKENTSAASTKKMLGSSVAAESAGVAKKAPAKTKDASVGEQQAKQTKSAHRAKDDAVSKESSKEGHSTNTGASKITKRKASIHPQYREITVVMTNGETFKTRSTYDKGDVLRLDVDKNTHVAWTGSGVINQSASEVEKFKGRFGGINLINMKSE